jgi:hypothetical protein
MPPSTPSETDNLLAAIRAQTARIHTMIPGTVVSYNEATQTATCQPSIKGRHKDATGALVAYTQPALPNCPIAFPSGGGYSITWKLEAGDPVLLLFAERALDEWKTVSGGDHEPRDAVRRFDLTDAIALPCGKSPSSPLPAEAYSADAMVVAVEAGKELRLGSSAASDFVALASLVSAQLDALATALDSWVVVPNDGGAALKTILVALRLGGWPGAVAATKVKAE